MGWLGGGFDWVPCRPSLKLDWAATISLFLKARWFHGLLCSHIWMVWFSVASRKCSTWKWACRLQFYHWKCSQRHSISGVPLPISSAIFHISVLYILESQEYVLTMLTTGLWIRYQTIFFYLVKKPHYNSGLGYNWHGGKSKTFSIGF